MALPAAACLIGILGIATAAIITVIYLTTKTTQKKKIAYSSNRSVHCNGFEYHYDPKTKSVVKSASPVSSNNLRKRTPSLSSTIDKKSEKSSDQKSNLKVVKDAQSGPVGINNYVDHNILSDKMPMSTKEKVIRYLNGDIPVSNSETHLENTPPINNLDTFSNSSSSSWSILSSEMSTDSFKKAYKKKVHRSLRNYVSNMIQANCDLHSAENSYASESDNLSTSSSWSNISSEKSNDDFEKAYKKKVLRKFLKTIDKTSKTALTDESSSSISGDLEVCLACQRTRVNTRMEPCNHRYMCSDCSKLFFRLCNKCNVCQAKIENFVEE